MKNLTPTLTKSNDLAEILAISRKLDIETEIETMMKKQTKGVAEIDNYLFTFSCTGETIVYHSPFQYELILAALFDAMAETEMEARIRQAA